MAKNIRMFPFSPNDRTKDLQTMGNRNIPRNKLMRDPILITNRAARRFRAATDPKVKSGTLGKAFP